MSTVVAKKVFYLLFPKIMIKGKLLSGQKPALQGITKADGARFAQNRRSIYK